MDTETQAVEPAIAENSAEPVEQVETSAESAPAAEPEAKPEPRDKVQERIDKLTREKYEAQRERDMARWELERSREEKAKPEPVAPAKPLTLADYDYDEAKFQAAAIEFAAAEARRAALEEIKKEREESARKAKLDSWRAKEAKFAEKTADYRDVVYADEIPISEAMAQVIQESDEGPAVAYYLAKNRDLAQAIYSLPPIQAARELGKIEARLASPPTKAAPVSSAPPPPPRIEAASASVPIKTTDPESDKLSDEEWRRRRDKELSRKR